MVQFVTVICLDISKYNVPLPGNVATKCRFLIVTLLHPANSKNARGAPRALVMVTSPKPMIARFVQFVKHVGGTKFSPPTKYTVVDRLPSSFPDEPKHGAPSELFTLKRGLRFRIVWRLSQGESLVRPQLVSEVPLGEMNQVTSRGTGGGVVAFCAATAFAATSTRMVTKWGSFQSPISFKTAIILATMHTMSLIVYPVTSANEYNCCNKLLKQNSGSVHCILLLLLPQFERSVVGGSGNVLLVCVERERGGGRERGGRERGGGAQFTCPPAPSTH